MYHHINKSFRSAFIPALLMSGAVGAVLLVVNTTPLQSAPSRANVVLGKKVVFSPVRKNPGQDSVSLTDGKTLPGQEGDLSRDPDAVKWAYPGQVSIAVDLGQFHDIDEIAIRLQNGSATYTQNSGRTFPGWVEAFVSDDGENYTKVAEFSRWNPGDFKKFDIGQERGKAWMERLSFKDLKTQGRWVGLRIYGSPRMASDELYVFGTPIAGATTKTLIGQPSGFTVTRPQIYFPKPYLELANNIPLPVPVGVTVPGDTAADVELNIDLPPGLKIISGNLSKIDITSIKATTLPDGWQRYSFSVKDAKTKKDFGRLFLQATNWKDGQKGELKYRFGDASWRSPQLSIPVRAVHVPAAPRLKTIMTSLGWWNDINPYWAGQQQALKTVGINSLSVLTGWGISAEVKSVAAAARREGLFVSAVESPFHVYVRNLRGDRSGGAEIFDQFAGGKVGTKLCVSYRGKYYWKEINNIAGKMAGIQPDFISMDNEQWGSDGPVSSRKCLRCQADFKASGLASWEEWQQAKGAEIVTDLANSIRKAMQAKGMPLPKIGSYNVSPEHVYQQVYNFENLYPKVLDTSEGSTYTSLQPADIAFIGNKARGARSKMARSDVMPWITPGDAGGFPGAALQWTLLEAYTNGARGVWFWSNRVWDAEDLIAYNRVIRAIASVEEVIVKGDLVGNAAAVQGKGRISGMKFGSRMVLLAADYLDESGGTVKVQLNLSAKSRLRDLLSGETVAVSLLAGQQSISIPLRGEQARLLEVVPE